MRIPPRLAITVGMAVATTVDSMAARNMAHITPATTTARRWRSMCSPTTPASDRTDAAVSGPCPFRLERISVTTGAPGALAPRAQIGVRVEALVAIGPAHAERVRLLLDVARPRHGLGHR